MAVIVFLYGTKGDCFCTKHERLKLLLLMFVRVCLSLLPEKLIVQLNDHTYV
jgi:hypothetical protein